MKNVSSIKSTDKIESPKTPGGISKSLLTPCRRLGLSRSWRKSGISPFVSPLSNSQNNINETQTEKVPRKRKKDSPEKEFDREIVGDTETNTLLKKSKSESEDASQTPTRASLIRKRSKTLLLAKESLESECLTENTEQCENLKNIQQINTDTHVSKLSRHQSKSKHGKDKLPKSNDVKTPNNNTMIKETELKAKDSCNELDNTNQRSPQSLTTECIVVIQKEIIKTNKDSNNITVDEKDKQKSLRATPSRTSLDSDSDDIPLCQINRKEQDLTVNKKENETTKLDEQSGNKKEEKVAKLENKKTSTTDLKTVLKRTKPVKRKLSKEKVTKLESKPSFLYTEKVTKIESKSSSQSSNPFDDDDDDDDFDHKRTIIIRKSYDKVKLPSKAKSTGSITDKDVEELKARIEAKKKLLMVKAMGNDTEDLRELIKKWQKGCQDALVELMELMKKKMPDQPNMDNMQLLDMLKIPQDLVGYDAENDCFNSPNDANIILSSLKI